MPSRFPHLPLLPGLALVLAAGIFTVDRSGVASRALWDAWGPLACATCLVIAAGVPRLRMFGLVVAFGLLGGTRQAGLYQQAAALRPSSPFDAVVEGTVCAVAVARGVGGGVAPGSGMRASKLCRVELVSGPRVGGHISRVRLSEAFTESAAFADSAGAAGALWPGDRVRARLRIRAPVQRVNPGGRASEGRTRLARRGVAAVGHFVHPLLVVRIDGPIPWSWRCARAAALLRASALRALPAQTAGAALLRALAVGDRSALASEVREAFVALGVAHVLAVSGLHLVLVAGGATFGLRLLLARSARLSARWDTRAAATLAGCAIGLGYAALTGFATPVSRALAFWLCASGSVLLRRRKPSPVDLAGAAWVCVIGLDPAALFELGTHLSFAAASALLWARRGAGGWFVNSLETTAVAIAATAPMLGAVGLPAGAAGLVVNLLAVPLIGWLLLPLGLASALLGALVPGSCAGTLLFELAAGVADAAVEFAVWAAAWRVSSGASAAAPASAPVLLVASGCATCVIFARGRASRGLWLALELCLVAHGPRAAPLAWGGPLPRIVAFDVGSGDAILLQGRQASVLVDGGIALPGRADSGRLHVVPALAALGVTRLAAVVATHSDADHAGGLPAVLRAIETAELWLPRGAGRDPRFAALREEAHWLGVRTRELDETSGPLVRGDLVLAPLWPAAGGYSADSNAGSLVLRAEASGGGLRALLTGDIGQAQEHALLSRHAGGTLRAEILKLAHHGSGTSTSRAFLAAVAPRVVLLSAACGRRGLPHRRLWERLLESDARLAWTGRDGAVSVSLVRGESWRMRRKQRVLACSTGNVFLR